MLSLDEQREIAERHVRRGRIIIARQQYIVAAAKARGQVISWAENLLALFEKSQAIFEADLASITSQIVAARLREMLPRNELI